MSSTFRTDINGLRAWAVLLVVLFHFQIPGFGAGFLGVDVFFVISGYLMASILFSGLSTGTLSLRGFYAARMKRIYPALMVLCVSCLVAGWFLLTLRDYMNLGAHVRESLLFSSNYRYLSEAGYFDVAAEEKWLLHTWSLSVEWQFYLIYPLLVLGLYRLTQQHRALLRCTLAIALVSLLWNHYCAIHQPDVAFYAFPGRAWELLLGSATYHLTRLWHPTRHSGFGLHIAGLALIVLAACVVTPSSWPGLWALLPTAGACILILGNSESPLTRARFWRWCGERSYSIYLWHWPVVALLHYFMVANDPMWIVGGIAASLMLAELSYRLVEQPTRRGLAHLSPGKTLVVMLSIAALLASLGQAVRRTGIPERLPDDVVMLVDRDLLSNPRQDKCLQSHSECVYGEGPIGLIMIGDSHADAVVTAVETALAPAARGILFKGDSGCISLPGLAHTDTRKQDCLQMGDSIPEILSRYPGTPVLLISRLSEYANGGQIQPEKTADFYIGGGASRYSADWFDQFSDWYLQTVCEIASARPVWLMRPTPEMTVDVANQLGRQRMINRRYDLSLPRIEHDRRHRYVRALQDEAMAQCGVHILDPTELLCDEEHCPAEYEGLPIYRDDDHLSEHGNRLLIPLFQTMLDQWPR